MDKKFELGKKYVYVGDEGLFHDGEIITLDFFDDDGEDYHSYTDGTNYYWVMASDVEPYEEEEEYTGGSSNYYKIDVTSPTTLEEGYTAECNDIIEALDMNFAEGNIFKAVWRRAASRLGKKKAGHNEDYDAEKILFFAKRLNGMKAE